MFLIKANKLQELYDLQELNSERKVRTMIESVIVMSTQEQSKIIYYILYIRKFMGGFLGYVPSFLQFRI